MESHLPKSRYHVRNERPLPVRGRRTKGPYVYATTLAADIRELLREQRDYRELLLRITARDLLLRYKQTAMGAAWAVFMPLLNTAMFTVIFTRVAPLDTGLPYPLYAYCGLVTWNWFASSTRFAITSLTSNATLVTKVYFPREALPFSAVIVGFVDLLVASLVLVALMAYYGVAPTAAVVLLPLFLAVGLAAALGVGLWFAALNVRFRDVRYVLPFIMQLWLFASPVAYSTSLIESPTARALYALNPMAGVIQGFRWALIGAPMPGELIWPSVVVALLLLASGILFFKRMEETFADVI